MEKIDHKEISMDEYRKIESKIDSMITENQLIETHKKLIGNSCKCNYWETNDCGVNFIKKFLCRDWSRTIVYNYSQGANQFIQSKYLSDYFKNSIKEILSGENLNEEVLNVLNSDKLINDMSEEEILSIYSAIKECYNQSPTPEKESVADYFLILLYKLNGPGVASFIKNNVNNIDLASHILLTSGLNDRASFYSGYGVDYNYLNENNLISIFNKLLKLDVDYAINFADMVRQMKTLGAAEFITSFMNLAGNDFKSETLNIEDSNISIDGLYGSARDTVGFVSVMNMEKDQDYQIAISEQMKSSFMSRIKPILQLNNPDYDKKSSKPLNYCYSFKRK